LKEWWREHGDEHHPFNRGEAILAAVRERFEVLHVERGPYFYRYLADRIAEHTGVDHGAALFDLEQRLIAGGRIKALELRIVAVR